MGKIRCDAGGRDARRGKLYTVLPPVLPVTPMRDRPTPASVERHRRGVHASQVQKRGPMYTAPKVSR